MKILYLHQYFRTPEEGGSIRSWYLASALVKAGHELTMVTAHNGPGMIRKSVNGFHVIYLPVPYSQSYSSIKRMKAFYDFASGALREGLKIQADICFATSSPLSVGWTALKLKKKKSLPYIFEARDLWPEVPIRMGIFRDPVTKRLLRSLEKRIYRGAEKIIALSPAILNAIQKTVPEKPVILIPNMSDPGFFSRDQAEEYISGDSSAFTICYAGALGRANRVEYLLRLAKLTKEKNLDVKYMICGTGTELGQLQYEAGKNGLHNVQFTGHLSKDEVGKILMRSDASYISFAEDKILETCSPNKFFEALAAGNVCITNTGGWIKDLIETNNCGFYAAGNDAEKAVSVLEKAIHDRSVAETWKKNARKLAEEFSVEKLSGKFVRLFNEKQITNQSP